MGYYSDRKNWKWRWFPWWNRKNSSDPASTWGVVAVAMTTMVVLNYHCVVAFVWSLDSSWWWCKQQMNFLARLTVGTHSLSRSHSCCTVCTLFLFAYIVNTPTKENINVYICIYAYRVQRWNRSWHESKWWLLRRLPNIEHRVLVTRVGFDAWSVYAGNDCVVVTKWNVDGLYSWSGCFWPVMIL